VGGKNKRHATHPSKKQMNGRAGNKKSFRCNTFIPGGGGGGVREIIKSRCCARGNLKLFAAAPETACEQSNSNYTTPRAPLSAIKKNELLQQLRNKIALKTHSTAHKMFRGKSSGLIAHREQYRLLNFIETHKQNVLAQSKLLAMNLEF